MRALKAFRGYLARNVNWLLAVLMVMVLFQPDIKTAANNRQTITFGTPEAYAAGTADYSLGTDGAANAVTVQTALDALPNQGGLLHFKAGTYNITSGVTRAIGNVTIEGEGIGTKFIRNGSAVIFTAGGNNWVFRDLAVDSNSTISMGATTGWSWVNVYDQSTLWNSRVQSGQVVFATANGTTLFVTSLNGTTLNATQITGTTGNLTTAYITSLNMTGDILPTSNNTRSLGSTLVRWLTGWFVNLVSETHNTTQLTATTANISTLNAPTGGGAYFIAASNALALEKARADIIVDGVADEQQILAAYNAGYKNIELSSGNFNAAAEISTPANVWLHGQGNSTIYTQLNGTNITTMFFYSDVDGITYSDMTLDFNGVNQGAGAGVLRSRGDNTKYLRLVIQNTYSTNYAIQYDAGNGIWIEDCVFINAGPLTTAQGGSPITKNVWVQRNLFINPVTWATGSAIGGSATNYFIDYNTLAVASTVAQYSPIDVAGTINGTISNNILSVNSTTTIYLEGASGVRVYNNWVTTQIWDNAPTGTNYIYNNSGYVTENSGNFTITAGQWGASIAHGLATNATAVQLTLTGNTTTTVYVSFGSITSTNFTANLSALQGGDVTGVWRAVIGAGN